MPVRRSRFRQTSRAFPPQDRNNLIYVPLHAAIFRLEDVNSRFRDEIDGIYLQMRPGEDIPAAAALLRGLLNVSHRGAADFAIVSPAELLAEQRRTQRIFEMVMVAIASISLLVGGIGIMNIMLASVMERTREIGVRRAIGAKKRDIIRQFLIETTIISLAGGVMGVLVVLAAERNVPAHAGCRAWGPPVPGRPLRLVAGAGATPPVSE